ncbi:transmembrane protein 221 [Trichomycterus rosablanca]|uniref:transmembrane protein 221 n=1 Tax=Trichomycterus rosablanca TaxID=2290929 RepID=UPI002F351D66
MSYSQKTLLVLALLGILSAVMSLMSGSLIFQLHSGVKESESPVSDEIFVVLKPISAVLSALSLTMTSSSTVICLLHAYFSAELWRDHTQRVEWFLSDSRSIRHAAIGLFCGGISIYLCALSVYVLLAFEIETGITSACLLFSGAVVLVIIIVYSLIRAMRTTKHFSNQHADMMYQNDSESNTGICTVASDLNCREKARKQEGEGCQFCYTHSPNPRQQHLPSGVSHNYFSNREANAEKGYMHRTLSAESGLYQGRTKPWNGIDREMRTVMTHKTKDSTLV